MKAWRTKIFLFFCMLLLIPQVNSANIRIQVEGISGDLQSNVYERILTINDNLVAFNSDFKIRLDHEVHEVLRAFGYYSPTVSISFNPSVHESHNTLIVRICPGKPIKTKSIRVILHGDARKDSDYLKWILDCKSIINEVLKHSAYENFKNGFYNLALHKGYFDAEFKKSQLGVSVSRYQSYWDFEFNSGQRYRVGKIHFYGTQIRSDYLHNLILAREGDPYSTELLSQIHDRLVSINWFNSVTILPNFINREHNKTLPLDVMLMPQSNNKVEIDIGYTTNTGIRSKALWMKPYLNSLGHSLLTDASLSASEQTANIIYKIPLLKNPLERYYQFQVGFKHDSLNDTQSDSITLNLSRYWNSSHSWQRAVNLRWSLDRYMQNGKTKLANLVYPRIIINRTHQHGDALMSPVWGTSQRYSLDVSNAALFSGVNFLILQAQNIWVQTLAEKHRFIARTHFGWIETNNLEQIPLSMRFFAGGDQSIRGYPYKSLSPHDKYGKLLGASKLATGSLEYQYNITDNWWNTVFIDSGEAINDIRKSNIKIGTGMGIRWHSLFGPVKLDIAVPITDRQHKIQFYIGLGSEL